MAMLAHGMVTLTFQIVGVVMTVYLGRTTNWHAGIILIMWLGIAVIGILYGTVAGRPGSRIAKSVSTALGGISLLSTLAIALIATVRLNQLSNGHSGIILIVWSGLLALGTSYTVLVATSSDPTRPGAAR